VIVIVIVEAGSRKQEAGSRKQDVGRSDASVV